MHAAPSPIFPLVESAGRTALGAHVEEANVFSLKIDVLARRLEGLVSERQRVRKACSDRGELPSVGAASHHEVEFAPPSRGNCRTVRRDRVAYRGRCSRGSAEADSLAWKPGAVRARGEGRRATGLEPRPDGARAPRATRTVSWRSSEPALDRAQQIGGSRRHAGVRRADLERLLGEVPRARLEKLRRRSRAVTPLAMAGAALLKVERSAGRGVGVRERTLLIGIRGHSQYEEKEEGCRGSAARAKMARCTALRDRSIDARINQWSVPRSCASPPASYTASTLRA